MAYKGKKSEGRDISIRAVLLTCLPLSVFHAFGHIFMAHKLSVPAPWGAIVGTAAAAVLFFTVHMEMEEDGDAPLFGAAFFLILTSAAVYLTIYAFAYALEPFWLAQTEWSKVPVPQEAFIGFFLGCVLLFMSWTLAKKTSLVAKHG